MDKSGQKSTIFYNKLFEHSLLSVPGFILLKNQHLAFIYRSILLYLNGNVKWTFAYFTYECLNIINKKNHSAMCHVMLESNYNFDTKKAQYFNSAIISLPTKITPISGHQLFL